MGDDLERIWKETVVAYRYYPGIWLDRENHENPQWGLPAFRPSLSSQGLPNARLDRYLICCTDWDVQIGGFVRWETVQLFFMIRGITPQPIRTGMFGVWKLGRFNSL
jgi:hypothetical protein